MGQGILHVGGGGRPSLIHEAPSGSAKVCIAELQGLLRGIKQISPATANYIAAIYVPSNVPELSIVEGILDTGALFRYFLKQKEDITTAQGRAYALIDEGGGVYGNWKGKYVDGEGEHENMIAMMLAASQGYLVIDHNTNLPSKSFMSHCLPYLRTHAEKLAIAHSGKPDHGRLLQAGHVWEAALIEILCQRICPSMPIGWAAEPATWDCDKMGIDLWLNGPGGKRVAVQFTTRESGAGQDSRLLIQKHDKIKPPPDATHKLTLCINMEPNSAGGVLGDISLGPDKDHNLVLSRLQSKSNTTALDTFQYQIKGFLMNLESLITGTPFSTDAAQAICDSLPSNTAVTTSAAAASIIDTPLPLSPLPLLVMIPILSAQQSESLLTPEAFGRDLITFLLDFKENCAVTLKADTNLGGSATQGLQQELNSFRIKAKREDGCQQFCNQFTSALDALVFKNPIRANTAITKTFRDWISKIAPDSGINLALSGGKWTITGINEYMSQLSSNQEASNRNPLEQLFEENVVKWNTSLASPGTDFKATLTTLAGEFHELIEKTRLAPKEGTSILDDLNAVFEPIEGMTTSELLKIVVSDLNDALQLFYASIGRNEGFPIVSLPEGFSYVVPDATIQTGVAVNTVLQPLVLSTKPVKPILAPPLVKPSALPKITQKSAPTSTIASTEKVQPVPALDTSSVNHIATTVRAQLESQLAAMREKSTQKSGEVKKIEERIAHLDEEISNLDQQIHQLNESTKTINSQFDTACETIRSSNNMDIEKESQIADLRNEKESSIDDLVKNYKGLKNSLDGKKTERQGLTEQLVAAEKNGIASAAVTALEDKLRRLAELTTQALELEAQKSESESMIGKVQESLILSNQAKNDAEGVVKKAKTAKRDAEEALKKAESALNEAKAQADRAQKAHEENQVLQTRSMETLGNNTRELAKIAKTLESLKVD